jgi:hypothetical protein
MGELKEYNLYDVEFTSVQGYSGRAIAKARYQEDAEGLTRKVLEEAGYITTSADVYDVMVLNIEEVPSSLLVGVIYNSNV